jgi:hypothetical protein
LDDLNDMEIEYIKDFARKIKLIDNKSADIPRSATSSDKEWWITAIAFKLGLFDEFGSDPGISKSSSSGSESSRRIIRAARARVRPLRSKEEEDSSEEPGVDPASDTVFMDSSDCDYNTFISQYCASDERRKEHDRETNFKPDGMTHLPPVDEFLDDSYWNQFMASDVFEPIRNWREVAARAYSKAQDLHIWTEAAASDFGANTAEALLEFQISATDHPVVKRLREQFLERISGVPWVKIFAALGTMMTVATVWRWFSSSADEDTDEFIVYQSRQKRDHGTKRSQLHAAHRKRDRRLNPTRGDRAFALSNRFSDLQPQAGYSVDPDDPDSVPECDMMGKVTRNCCTLYLEDGSFVHGIMVKGTTLMLNRHFFCVRTADGIGYMNEGDVFFVDFPDRDAPVPVVFERKRLSEREIGSSIADLAFYDLPTGGPNTFDYYSDITRFFITDAELARTVSIGDATLVGSKDDRVIGRSVGLTTRVEEHVDWDRHIAGAANNIIRGSINTVVPTFWRYSETNPGDCGKMLVNDSKQARIVGMHVFLRKEKTSGRRNGLSMVITRERLLSALGEYTSPTAELSYQISDVTLDSKLVRCGVVTDMPLGNFEPIGFVSKGVTGASTTKLQPSLIADTDSKVVAACKKVPAILSYADPRILGRFENQNQFLTHNCGKNGTTAKGFNRLHASTAMEDLFNQYTSTEFASRAPCGLLTEDEVINGGGRFTKVNKLNMSKSAGYPFTKETRHPGKKGFFVFNDETELYEIRSEDFRARVAKQEEHMMNNERPAFIWMNFFKDELVSKKKIDEARTRVICGSPLDYTMLTRKYFGAFINVFYASHTLTDSAVGISVFSEQWHKMISKMKSKATHGFDGDFRSFDSRMHQQFVNQFGLFVEQWYKENDPNYKLSDKSVRAILLHECMHTLELIGNSLYRSNHGNPSGNPLTTILNTLYSQWLLRMGYLARFPSGPTDPDSYLEEHPGGMPGFRRYIEAAVYGDDHMVAVHPIAQAFNAQSFGDWLATHDIQYTPAVKGAALSPINRPIDELMFLSCTTVVSDLTRSCTYMPRVDISSVAKCVKYVRPEGDPVGALVTNINDSLRRVWPSGAVRFKEIRDDLVAACRSKSIDTAGIMTFGDGLYNWSDKIPIRPDYEYIPQKEHESDEVTYETQMLGATTLVSSVQADNVSQAVVPPSNDGPRAERVMGMKQSIRHICRRAHMNYYFPREASDAQNRVIPMHSFYANVPLSGIDTGWRRSGLSHWAAPFRVRHDSPVLTFLGSAGATLAYRAYSEGFGGNNGFDFGQAFGRDPDPTLDTWFGPVDYGSEESGIIMVKTAFTTATNTLLLPKKSDDNGASYNNGFVFLRLDPMPLQPGRVLGYAQFGDNSRFGMLYAVPNLKLNAAIQPPDTYPTALGMESKDVEYEYQMGQAVSYNRNINIANITDSAMDIGGSDEFENGQSVDAKASMDKHNIGVSYMAFQRRAFPMLSNGCNLTQAQHLAIEPGGTVGALPEVMSTSTDEMSIAHLTQLNYYQTFIVPTSAESGDVIAFGQITPTPNLLTARLGDTLQPPIIEYTSSKFSFWQGGLKYRFSVSKAQVATGRLAVVLLYGKTSVPASLPNVMGQYAHVLDLTSDNLTFDIEAPYRSVVPRLNVASGAVNLGSLHRYSMGMWAIVVLNPIRTTTTAAPFLYVNMFMGAADDFKLTVYGQKNYTLIAEVGVPPDLADERELPDLVSDDDEDSDDDDEDDDVSYEYQMMSSSDANGATGVTFSETSAVAPLRDNAQEVKRTSHADSMLPENQISFTSLAQRPQLVSTFKWNVGDAKNVEIFSGRVPWDFIIGSNVAPFKQFQYYRGSLHVTVKVQATAFHTGTLIVYFVPLTSDAEIDAHHVSSVPSKTIVQHQFLVASDSNTVTLNIPFHQIQSWLNTDDQRIDCGGLRVAVFNPLVVGEGQLDNAEVSLFASFPESQFKVINPDAFPTVRFREIG